MITIEKIRTYVPITEKIAMADKIASAQTIDENGIVNKNWLKIVSTCFFVGLFTEDQIVTTNDYDEIIQQGIDISLRIALSQTAELQEWDEILHNAIDNVVEQNKIESTNFQMAAVRLLNTVNKKVEKVDLEKALKMILKAMKNPDAAKNVKEIFDLSKIIKNPTV
jgi:hypothetical protein